MLSRGNNENYGYKRKFDYDGQLQYPSEDILNFGFWETIDSEVIIEIFDAKGQKMNDYRLYPQKETLSISVNKWLSGIYFWKILYKNTFYTGKFIKSSSYFLWQTKLL